MSARSPARRLALSGAAIGLSIALFAFLAWVPEVDSDPANTPVVPVSLVSARTVPLDVDVRNPAGISYASDRDTYLITTDDRLLVEVSSDFSSVLSTLEFPRAPLSLSDTEGVVYLGEGRAAVVAENGVVVLLERDEQGWAETERFPIDTFNPGTLLGSAAFDPVSGSLFTAQKTGEKVLYRVDIGTRRSTATPMELGRGLAQTPDGNWEDLYISGLHFHESGLIAVSEAFSSLLFLTPGGVVEQVTGLENINESSGITLRRGVLMLIGDAEAYLPDPPIYQVPLETVPGRE